MPSRTALGAAGLALTVAGGVSALFLTIGPIGSTSTDGTASSGATTGDEHGVVVEYVDQYGNPVDPSTLQQAGAIDGASANMAESGRLTVSETVSETVAASSRSYNDDDDDDGQHEDDDDEHEGRDHDEHEDGEHDDD